MFSDYAKNLCINDPCCIGWSETKKRMYYKKYPTYAIDAEIRILDDIPKSNLMAGIPIGGSASGFAYMGTLTWFAKDKQGNYYGITDAHVVYNYDTVYFPSPLLVGNPSLTAEHIPIVSPTPIGQVIYRSSITSQQVDLDMAVFTLNTKPTLISYGKILPIFFDMPHEVEPVIKVGARTGLTNGTVLDRLATVKMQELSQTVLFTGSLFAIHSEAGDSGSPIFVGNSIVSSIVGGTGLYAVGNYVVNMLSTLHSLGLWQAFKPTLIGVLGAVPFLAAGSVSALLAKMLG